MGEERYQAEFIKLIDEFYDKNKLIRDLIADIFIKEKMKDLFLNGTPPRKRVVIEIAEEKRKLYEEMQRYDRELSTIKKYIHYHQDCIKSDTEELVNKVKDSYGYVMEICDGIL